MNKSLMYVFSSFLLGFLSYACSENEVEGLTIDPSIKGQVEKHIRESKDFDSSKDFMLIYENDILGEFYENDTLFFSNDKPDKKQLFKCFYLWDKKDVLGINGAYGIFGGMGFYIKIKDNKAEVFHMLSSDDFPTYSYKENDSLIDRLEVPCKDTKIVLSELPDKTKNQIIYGYVEFKSENYYSATGTFAEGETPLKKKYRANMKIYFKSGHMKL